MRSLGAERPPDPQHRLELVVPMTTPPGHGTSPSAERGYDGWREEGVAVHVDLFVDPACMWSWLTSRWLVEVAPKRDLQVRWRPYSLLLRDGPNGLQDGKAALWGASLRVVRVMQALNADDPDRVRGFYEAVVAQGMAAYNAGRPPFQELEGALAAAGVASTYAGAADQVAWDEPIRQAMAEASSVVGEGVGTPVLVLYLDPPVGLLGPLVSPPRPGPRRCGCGTPWWPSPPSRGAGAVPAPATAPQGAGVAVVTGAPRTTGGWLGHHLLPRAPRGRGS
jgi:hypothetical protein